MRADAAQADRRHAVRTAAAAWRSAGAIDDATQRAIEAAYPDDRARLGLGLRILAGGAGLVGGGALAGLLFSMFGGSVIGSAFWLFLAAVFVAATELQTGRLRRADAGAELATAILAVGFACGWIASLDFDAAVIVFAGCALMAALAAWRWGHASLAAVAAFLALLSAGQSPFGRILWLSAGAVAIPMIAHLARSPRLPPAHRRSSWAAGLVGLAGGYVATNLYSLDHRWVHWLGDGTDPAPAAWARIAAIVGTIVIPPFVFAAGLRYRDRALLAAGAVFAAASLVTLRHYHPIGPWWLSLVLGGIACLSIAVGLRRRLEARPAHEWAGFTARPLFEDPRLLEAAQAAAVLAAISPAARLVHEAGFEGGGGRSGGGGATGSA
jgi:hypothetical protein